MSAAETADGPKVMMSIPEPQWVRGDRGLVNLVYYSGVGLARRREDDSGVCRVVAWDGRTGRQAPIRKCRSTAEAEALLDELAESVGAYILGPIEDIDDDRPEGWEALALADEARRDAGMAP